MQMHLHVDEIEKILEQQFGVQTVFTKQVKLALKSWSKIIKRNSFSSQRNPMSGLSLDRPQHSAIV